MPQSVNPHAKGFTLKCTAFLCLSRLDFCWHNHEQIKRKFNLQPNWELNYSILMSRVRNKKSSLTLENVQLQPLNSHWKVSDELPSASCDRRWRLIFFFSCFVPQMSQVIYWWEDFTWAWRHWTLGKCFKQPGSKHTISTDSKLTAE